MKKIIILFVVGLLTQQIQQITRAQGTTYLSNLGQTSDGSLAVGSDSWLAVDFTTGPNANGYMLNSIQLSLADAMGIPSGFVVMLYGTNGNSTGAIPGSSLGILNGSLDPATGGIYMYIPTGNLTLSPSTDYFIVLTSGTAIASGAYEWNFTHTSIYNPGDVWVLGVALSSSDGSSPWTRLGTNPQFDFSQFAITATPVPEPGVLSLFVLGGLGFLWWHCRKAKMSSRHPPSSIFISCYAPSICVRRTFKPPSDTECVYAHPC